MQAQSAVGGSGLAWCLLQESLALWQLVPREQQHPNWAGQEVGRGLWAGMALRSDLSTRFATKGRWGT